MTRVAIGPVMEGFGSWNWVGADVARELCRYFEVAQFDREIPECDVVLVIKHFAQVLTADIPLSKPIIYCPIDFYGDAGQIDGDYPFLSRCNRVLVHCQRLVKYFQQYTAVEYMDHHVKFAAPMRMDFREEGPLLWVGVRSNLPPLLSWLQERELPEELWILSNWETSIPSRDDLGISRRNRCRIGRWSPDRQEEWTQAARGALDIKGNDFRARHKPPSKAIDFIASGLPLAMNQDSSSSDHLRRMGFELAVPEDTGRWLSREYWEGTIRVGAALRELLSLERVGLRFRNIISDVVGHSCGTRRIHSENCGAGSFDVA